MTPPRTTTSRLPRSDARSTRHTVAALVSALALVGLAAGCGQTTLEAAAPTTTTTTAAPTTTTTAAPPKRTVPPAPPASTALVPIEDGWFLTATPVGVIKGYDVPDGPAVRDVTDKYYDIPTTLPVFEQVPGWLHIRLAPKPNGTTTWVKASDVIVGKTPWRIKINLTTTHLQLFKAGEQVLDAPVGVGTDATPTPTGDYFVTFLQKPTSAMYGPFVMITSGHSNVIQVWEGFPDGITAIHGPIGSDGMIGDTGAKISNGCIRMHVSDQQQLAVVQPGSPIQIVEA